jgi:hypothetical protein
MLELGMQHQLVEADQQHGMQQTGGILLQSFPQRLGWA